MRDVIRLALLTVLVAAIAACNGKPADQPAPKGQVEQKAAKDPAGDQKIAAAFMEGVKSGDKKKMYQAANLTPEQVKSCLDKLVHIKQNKMDEGQRKACEGALKVSGDIDFFAAKMQKLIPPSAIVKVVQTQSVAAPAQHLVHTVSITYTDHAAAVSDKTGKAVKELRLPLQQFDHQLDKTLVHEFAFTSQDFEKIASRDFEVVSYF
ncbi:hypothetical protein KOM00_18345 [Geomonas sp. Red69]|uniref:hypothetical protein n=1 Tax=Geomonas diazotrophica TaxID=2843197 RepID=UPI001C10789C|nr:hypothetical protein [Geomonas diazotrophica]MBU5638692.1 hypothetical protein [Geomonas diazotrophica]